MLELKDICKKYNGKNILSDINVSFNKPGLYVFSGVNGSGKSTILKIIAGVIYKSKGELESNEVISYLPDKYMLPKLVNVKKYLKDIIILNRSSIKIDDILSLWKLPKKRIGSLSKGNYQKVGIVQTLALNANYYLFDEPLDGLDEYARGIFKKSILELIDCGKKVIMSLHNDDLFNDLVYIKFEIKGGKINEEN